MSVVYLKKNRMINYIYFLFLLKFMRFGYISYFIF